MKYLIVLSFIFIMVAPLAATPFTIVKTNNQNTKLTYKTSLKLTQTFNKALKRQNEFQKKETSVIINQNFTYTPRPNLELLMNGQGRYQISDRMGLVNEEQKESLSLESFWIGMNYMNFLSMPSSFSNLPFEPFEPTLHISGGGLKNATAYFLKVSLGTNLTQRSYISTSWRQSFHQAQAREMGWKNSRDNYSKTNTSIEYTYKVNPLLRISFLNTYKQEREKENILKRYWFFIKKIF